MNDICNVHFFAYRQQCDDIFRNTNLILVFTLPSIYSIHVEYRFPKVATPSVVYKLTCTCIVKYECPTERSLYDCVCDHLRSLLIEKLDSKAMSRIIEPLLESGHSCSQNYINEVNCGGLDSNTHSELQR